MNSRRRAAEKRIRGIKAKRPAHGCPPALEWLTEGNSGIRITLFGARRALVENHSGVAAFSQSCIQLRSRRGIVSFKGEELFLSEVRPDGLIICGRISTVELPGGEAHA